MSKQTDAMRLADKLEDVALNAYVIEPAVAELRRQHAEIERLTKFCDDLICELSGLRMAASMQKRIDELKASPSAQGQWVGLTDEEILSDDILRYYYGMNGGAGPVSQKGKKVVAAIEAKLKEKNT